MIKPADVPQQLAVTVPCELLDAHNEPESRELAVTYRVAADMTRRHLGDDDDTGLIAETRIPLALLEDAGDNAADKLADLVENAIERDVGEAMADYKTKLQTEQAPRPACFDELELLQKELERDHIAALQSDHVPDDDRKWREKWMRAGQLFERCRALAAPALVEGKPRPRFIATEEISRVLCRAKQQGVIESKALHELAAVFDPTQDTPAWSR